VAGEFGFNTGPYVIVAAFCDTVIEGKDGVLSLIRLIDRIDIQADGAGAPDHLPTGTLATTLVVQLRAGEALGAQRIQVGLERPDGTIELGPERALNFTPGRGGGANIILPMQIEIRSAGLHWAVVFINDRPCARTPLEVRYGFKRA
jgi:hypothetical protein